MARSPSLLETTENTRDLGGHTAPDGRVTRYHVLLRSDVPREPSSRDVTYLREHGIDTIIDLRESSATERDGSFFAERDGFHCCPCPIPEGSGIPASPAAVPESYMGIVESPGTASALAAMADAPGGVLFHCTAGKDRTGVLSAVNGVGSTIGPILCGLIFDLNGSYYLAYLAMAVLLIPLGTLMVCAMHKHTQKTTP